MKKFLAVILSLVVVCTAFVACSSKNKKEEPTESTSKVITTSAIPTEKAKVKEGDAIDFIKNAYTVEELGLADVEENYSFMVAQSAVIVEGSEYIKVAANVMTQNEEPNEDGQITYSLTPVGEYYISFDAKKILSKDMKTGEYKKLKNKYDEYYKEKAKNASTDKAK